MSITAQSVSAVTTQTWQARLAAQDASLHIHLLGIGGAGLSAIAYLLRELNFQVSGSDRQLGPNLQRLADVGVQLLAEQKAENLTGDRLAQRPDVVLISSAISPENPEYQAALRLGIPVVKRADFLPVLLANRQLIAVAGTAGKTTTTAMIVKVLREGGIAAGYIIGADLPGYGNAAAGRHACFVLEADEYDQMFLGFSPTVAVVTNVEWDHPDCYPTPESFRAAFRQFVASTKPDGLIISCADDSGAEQLRQAQQGERPRWLTYGAAEQADWQAVDLLPVVGGGYQGEIAWRHTPQGRLALQAPGLHNLRNALAAVAVADWAGLPVEGAFQSLATFGGTARRFEHKGTVRGVTVIDDYAHHPTKIVATLAAARKRYPQQRLWAVFQPHTYSRTKHLLQEMAASFADADQVLVTDIYAAREPNDGSVHATDIIAASDHPHIQYTGELAATAAYLAEQVQSGDVVIVLGAGDSYKIGEMLLAKLRGKA
ncbi:MAG: UDP-N-acetylmuramate--L-alanine ligase [Caldilineaceae bacterium]